MSFHVKALVTVTLHQFVFILQYSVGLLFVICAFRIYIPYIYPLSQHSFLFKMDTIFIKKTLHMLQEFLWHFCSMTCYLSLFFFLMLLASSHYSNKPYDMPLYKHLWHSFFTPHPPCSVLIYSLLLLACMQYMFIFSVISQSSLDVAHSAADSCDIARHWDNSGVDYLH